MTEWLLRRLHPVTRKRLRRFRETRRAWWAFCILSVAYVLSLGSELICNDTPLWVRFDGHTYFPIFRFHPDDTFTGSGYLTRPNYKKVLENVRFLANPDNRMVFPPFPYGPYETLDASDVKVPDEVVAAIAPAPHTGSADVTGEGAVDRSVSAGYFFAAGEGEPASGVALARYYVVPADFQAAMKKRLANEECPAIEAALRPAVDGDWPAGSAKPARVVASLSAFRPRATPPRTVRLTLREPEPEGSAIEQVTFAADMKSQAGVAPHWKAATDEERQAVLDLVRQRFAAPVEPHTLPLGGQACRVEFRKADVSWPFHPVAGHLLGIDESGRDVLARILYGFRISMTFGLLLVVSSMAAGILIGALQGYLGGLTDLTCQRLIEIWSALPFLYIMILMGSIFGRSFMLLLFIYGIFNWIGISYYIRAEFLKLRKLQFVEAARCLGVPTWRILWRHILPNALVPVITFFPFSLVGAIGSLAALDYLGFGMPPPTASWGDLLNQAQTYRWAWWLVTYPSISLFLVMLLGVFVGEGVRNAFDPRDYSGVA
jgi:microcin C transport system permease protein